MGKRLYILIMVCCVVLSCSKEPIESPESGREVDIMLSFTYKSNDTGTLLAMDYESAIHDLDVFAFQSDGICIGQLVDGTDYISNEKNDGARTLDVTTKFLTEYAGQSLTFYFVGNNTKSNDFSTLDIKRHISTFSGTEGEFAELLTNPLGKSVFWPCEEAEYIQLTPSSGALLMTGKCRVNLTTKHKIELPLRRRVARFDIINPDPDKLRITEIRISKANVQGFMFANASGINSLAEPCSIEIIDGPGIFDNDHVRYVNDANGENRAAGLFYLYPTKLGETTTIMISGYIGNTANEVNFSVNSNMDILANRCYTLKFDEQTSEFIVNCNPDDPWSEGGSLGM